MVLWNIDLSLLDVLRVSPHMYSEINFKNRLKH